jgi:thiamine-monophosphate kinase
VSGRAEQPSPPRVVRDVGEFGLIERITRALGPQPAAVLLGPGDDAALVAAAGEIVVSTDLLVEGRHFRFDWSSPYEVGRKAAAQNLADIAAMGGAGTALLVGLAAPPALPLTVADGLVAGLRDEAAGVGAAVVGGDVVAASSVLLAVTALGDLLGRRPVTRAGARPGDRVVVAGWLGCSVAGMRLIESGEHDDPIAALHRCPDPPYELGPQLAGAGATAMIDVSDGLVADLGHVARASHVRIVLDVGALAAAYALGPVTVDDVLGGGEDHALAAALPPVGSIPAGCVAVGEVQALREDQEAGVVDGRTGEVLSVRGFDHFGGEPA